MNVCIIFHHVFFALVLIFFQMLFEAVVSFLFLAFFLYYYDGTHNANLDENAIYDIQ